MKNKHVLFFLFAAFACTAAAAQQVTPATSFGNNGTFQQSVYQEDADAGRPIIQPDGKLLIAVGAGDDIGYSTGRYIYRITTTGELDSSFANNGILQVGLLDRRQHSIMRGGYFDLQPDGKIVVATTLLDRNSYIDNIAVERYMPDGKPDSSFGANGVNSFSVGYLLDSLTFVSASNLKIKPNGKILVTAQGYNEESRTNISAVAEFNSNGHFDNSFGDSGVYQFTSLYEQNLEGLQVLPNNRFITTGFFYTGTTLGTCETIHKADGSIDSTKGTDGVIINGYSQQSNLLDVALQNNKLLVYTSIQTGDSLVAVLFRYNADGTLDNSFGINGMVNAFTFSSDYVSNPIIKVEDNGKIIIFVNKLIGHNYIRELQRFYANGSRDYTFGTNGALTDDLVDFALNHNRLYEVGAGYVASEDFPQLIVHAYDFCYTCATAENNNSITAQLKTADALDGITALHFYPNPVKDKLVVTGLSAAEITHLQLTDANGRIVQKATTQSTSFQWNVQSLTPGVYYLSIIKDKMLPLTYKVIKE